MRCQRSALILHWAWECRFRLVRRATGAFSLALQHPRADVRLSGRRIEPGHRAIPLTMDPCRRRRGGQGPVAGQPCNPGADQIARPEGRGCTARLVHRTDWSIPGIKGSPIGRLGRNSGWRRAGQRDGDVVAWIEGAATAAKTGHDTILSPAPVLYINNRQGTGPGEATGAGLMWKHWRRAGL